MNIEQVKGIFLALDGEILSDERAEKIAEAVNRYRHLCYQRRQEEFGALPNARRQEASFWQTVGKDRCEMCTAADRSVRQDIEDLFVEPFN